VGHRRVMQTENRSVAIVGAGMAGLSCAASLVGRAKVTLFDKGRRPGGRVATRRVDGLSFDHGAQYVTARGATLARIMTALEADGVVGSWSLSGGDGEQRWVGIPGMSALPRRIAADLAGAGAVFHASRHVSFLLREADGWWVRHLPAEEVRPGAVVDVGERAGPFDTVLVALPSSQAAPLLASVDLRLADAVAATGYAPCWAVMAACTERLEAPDCARPTEGPLSWIARDSSRPGQSALPDRWVLHASAAWSREHLEASPEEVAQDLLKAFTAAARATPLHLSAHRWRFALVERALGHDSIWNPDLRIGACGDWCIGPRVEAAWDSGTALASAL
jgi:renalase